MKYIKEHCKFLISTFFIFLIFNLYFFFLVPLTHSFYILYIDFLICLCYGIFLFIDYYHYQKKEKDIQNLLQDDDIIYTQLHNLHNQNIFEHDLHIIQSQCDKQYQTNCDLQDYITKWCHEMKLPLSALLLINEKITDPHMRMLIKEQLEKMRQQLNSALTGSRIQSHIYDLQITATPLEECLKISLKNNQFFLIQKHFEIEMSNLNEIVYTDKEWLVYIIDQIISNSIKYSQSQPLLKIYTYKVDQIISLCIEDNGVGILDTDIRRIFDKGFTGRNYHNGQYKSTGMGLYLVKTIIDKLGHQITVESEYEKYTRMTISFFDHRDYFHL